MIRMASAAAARRRVTTALVPAVHQAVNNEAPASASSAFIASRACRLITANNSTQQYSPLVARSFSTSSIKQKDFDVVADDKERVFHSYDIVNSYMTEEEFTNGCKFVQKITMWDGKDPDHLLKIKEDILANPDLANFRDYDRRTPLHLAACEGHLDVVKLLVEKGNAIINRSDRWGGSPLDDAQRNNGPNSEKIIDYLRSKGGRFGSTSLSKNLFAACWEGDVEELRTLLECKRRMGIDVTQFCDGYDKRTPAHVAAYEGHPEVLRLLLEHNFDVNAKDRWGTTPLDSAMAGSQDECTELLEKEYLAVRGTNSITSTYGREAILDLMHTYGKERDGHGLTLNVHNIKDMLKGIGQDCSDDAVKTLMKICDEDNNGLIDVEEFLAHHETFLGGRPARIILIVGGPGSGKGVLSERLTRECGVVHLSSGEMLREEVERQTDLGKQVEGIMKSGGLVSSAIMVTLMQKRMKDHPGKRILLDGFPRSQENARDLVTLCGKPELALHLTCDDTVLLERVMKRGESGERADDNFETAIQRVRNYHKYHDMTLDFLREENVPIVFLDGSQTPDGVWAQLRSIGRLMRSSVKF